jgi:hypothetical protein
MKNLAHSLASKISGKCDFNMFMICLGSIYETSGFQRNIQEISGKYNQIVRVWIGSYEERIKYLSS